MVPPTRTNPNALRAIRIRRMLSTSEVCAYHRFGCRLVRPQLRLGLPRPVPSWRTWRVTVSSVTAMRMDTAAAWAWRATLERASRVTATMSSVSWRVQVYQSSVEFRVDAQACDRGFLVDDVGQPLRQSSFGLSVGLQLVDRVPDAFDGGVQGRDITVHAFLEVGFGEAAGDALRGHSHGEQFLDDVIVQVRSDPLVFLGAALVFVFAARLLQLQGVTGVGTEAGELILVDLGVRRPAGDAADGQHTQHRTGRGLQRHTDDGADRARQGEGQLGVEFLLVVGDQNRLACHRTDRRRKGSAHRDVPDDRLGPAR